MDKHMLEYLLQTLKQTEDSIKKTAEYCSSYPEIAQEVVYMIETEFLSSRKDRKKLYLYLIHEIILDEKSKGRMVEYPYIKAFGNKLKNLFAEFTQVAENLSDMDKAFTIVRKWQKEEIYHPTFLDKLRGIMQSKYDQLKQQQETFNALNQRDSSAHKLLQHNIQIIKSFQPAYEVFKYLEELQSCDSRALEFNCRFDKFNQNDIKTLDEHELNQMIDDGEKCRDELIENVCKLQTLYRKVAIQAENDLKEYETHDQSQLQKFKDRKKELFTK